MSLLRLLIETAVTIYKTDFGKLILNK